jgi:hypothetical protein
MPKVVLPNGVLAAGAFLVPCLLCIPRNGIVQVIVLLLAAVAALWIGHFHPVVQRYLQQHPRQRWTLIVGCSFLLAALAIGDNVFARWWVMDDHEVAGLLGSDHQLGFGEMVQSLKEHPEVGAIGNGPRVRPAYHLIRHLEVWLWGDNLVLWYLARVVALGSVFTLCWHLLWRFVGGIDAGLLMLMIFCLPMWGDLWSRIGSSETYAMVGIAVSVVGVVLIERALSNRGEIDRTISKRRNILAWMLIATGAVVAIGCKENFLIMVPAVLAYAGTLWYRGKANLFAWAGILVVTVFGALIALTVVGALATDGGIDIYANQRSVSTLILATIRCLTAHFGAIMLLAIIGLVVFARRIQGDERLERLLPQIKATTLALVSLLVLFVSQFAFYDHFNLFDRRYAFPAALAPLLMLPLLVQLRLRYRKLRGDDRHRIRSTEFLWRLGTVLLVCVMGLSMQRQTVQHVHESTAFTNEVIKIADVCTSEPNKSVVFVSHNPWDYESLYGVAAFLRFYNVSNPIYLQLEGYERDIYQDDLNRMLAKKLQDASALGNETFRPIAELQLREESLGVGFSDRPAAVVCVGKFPCWE